MPDIPVKIPSADIIAILDAANISAVRQLFYAGFPLPGVSADHGDSDATLTVADSCETQLWGSPLTAIRTVTLSTVGASNGADFLIVRSASATGSFNLNIGTGPLKALSTAATWARVHFNGTAWVLVSYGAL